MQQKLNEIVDSMKRQTLFGFAVFFHAVIFWNAIKEKEPDFDNALDMQKPWKNVFCEELYQTKFTQHIVKQILCFIGRRAEWKPVFEITHAHHI